VGFGGSFWFSLVLGASVVLVLWPDWRILSGLLVCFAVYMMRSVNSLRYISVLRCTRSVSSWPYIRLLRCMYEIGEFLAVYLGDALSRKPQSASGCVTLSSFPFLFLAQHGSVASEFFLGFRCALPFFSFLYFCRQFVVVSTVKQGRLLLLIYYCSLGGWEYLCLRSWCAHPDLNESIDL
jgi:hypothetical protein